MSNPLKAPIVLDSTMKETNELLRLQNLMLSKMADMPVGLSDYELLRKIVRSGHARDFFTVGDQLILPWVDRSTNTEYTVPMDVAHFPIISTNGESDIPGMALQWHYTTPFSIQFSQYQAFYYAADGLEAGTYHVKGGTNWGKFTKDVFYQFTLSQPVPTGGQLAGFRTVADEAEITTKTVQSFASPSAATAIETVTISIGDAGTFLGVLASDSKSPLNGLQSVGYGYNRWLESAYRQWLNGEGQAWWTPQSNYDRPPTEAATKWGFLSGFEPGFLEILKPVKIQTARNTLIDDGGWDITYDRFFLPSKEEIFNTPQIAGEGVAWDYWKQRLGRSTPTANHPSIYPEYIKYGIEAQSTPYTQRLRSAYRSYSDNVWNVNSTGYVNYDGANYSYRSSPACIIGG